jgi:hypothetical protein
MAVERENVEKLMGWLAPDSAVLTEQVGAEALVQALALVAFNGETQWPDRSDQVDVYREDLERLLATDPYTESQFVELTKPDADPGMFFQWFIPVVGEWEKNPPADGAGSSDEAPTQDAGAAAGFPNPNFDGTPGTEFYKLDEATQQYMFADSAGSADWKTYEQRRYSDPAWDESWAMFYRVDNINNAYEFADAVTPGDRSSGVGETWLSQEEVHARAAGQQAAPGSAHIDVAADAVFAALLEASRAAFRANPALMGLSEEDMKAALMEVAREMISAQAGVQR